ncbi:MAG TPA: MotA/TolQ/ExbB proton channel family protein [Chlamydiales bacterium]|nr:MotA/TolQ/ExbB proton channel family protein [Chlamydiales bacterium]
MKHIYFLALAWGFPSFGFCDTTFEFKKVFEASPVIYSSLLLMSIFAMSLWLYTLVTFRPKQILPDSFSDELRTLLQGGKWDLAKETCKKSPGPLSSIIMAGLQTRDLGVQVMIDAMKTEGKRVSTPFWQRLSLLNDIAIVSPMLGLLGTVIGMFYAFYDVNRSVESINALFDGLGIAVGTTVLGLIVAILSMVFSTTLKYRFIKTLSHVETEALALSTLMPKQGA